MRGSARHRAYITFDVSKEKDIGRMGSASLRRDRSPIFSSSVPHLQGASHSKEALAIPKTSLLDKGHEARSAGNLPQRTSLKPFSAGVLRSEDRVGLKLPQHKVTLNRENSESSQQDNVPDEKQASRFLSILVDKGRVIKRKPTVEQMGKSLKKSEETHRLPHSGELQLFRSLRHRTSSFLEIHSRFGVSKHTIRGLIQRGLLMEVWGPHHIGIRFRLSTRGKARLKELEGAAAYSRSLRQRNMIHLKHRSAV